MVASATEDPLMNLEQIAAYASVGAGEVRRDMKRTPSDPRWLAGIKHRGRLKARRSAVNDWIDRGASPAA